MQTMSVLLLPLLFGLSGPAPAIQGIEVVAVDELAAEYEAIANDYQEAYNAWMQEYRAAENDEARMEVWNARPSAGEHAQKMMALVAKSPTSDTAFKACAWICGKEPTESMAPALAHVTDKFLNHEDIGQVVRSLRADPEVSENFYKTVLEKSTVKAGRGMACYQLVNRIKGQLTRGNPTPEEAAKLMEQAENLYGRMQNEFADVILYRDKTLADVAKGDLFELKNLTIGKTVPEIEGEDIDGVAFKLSDYRGKVVMLDFWGDW